MRNLVILISLALGLSSCSTTTTYDLNNDAIFSEYSCIKTKNEAILLRNIDTCNTFHFRKESSWFLSYVSNDYKERIMLEKAKYNDIIINDEPFCGERTFYTDAIILNKGTQINISSLETYSSFSVGVPYIQFTGLVLASTNNIYNISHSSAQILTNLSTPYYFDEDQPSDFNYREVNIKEYISYNYDQCNPS